MIIFVNYDEFVRVLWNRPFHENHFITVFSIKLILHHLLERLIAFYFVFMNNIRE